jgi:hypothetical protein
MNGEAPDCPRVLRRASLVKMRTFYRVLLLSSFLGTIIPLGCAEPSLQITFDIPENYWNNDGCDPECYEQFNKCQNPDPDEQHCYLEFDECNRQCENGQGGDPNQECWVECDMRLQDCLGNNGDPLSQCEQLYFWCTSSCREREGVVHTITLQIFEPPGASPFDCDDLAFNEVDPELLAASLVQEIAIGDVLEGIDRVAPKVLLARAFDSSGKTVVAGCRQVDEVNGYLEVALEAEPATVLTLEQDEFEEWTLGGMGLPGQIALVVTDAQSRPLEGVEIHWQTVGPAAKGFSDTEETGAEGTAQFSPKAPEAPGPAVLDIRAKWQRSDIPVIKGFKRPEPMLQLEFSGSALSELELGRIGPGGEMGFAGLSPCENNPQAKCLVFGYTQDGNQPQLHSLELETSPEYEAHLAIVPDTNLDHLVVVSGEAWLELEPREIALIQHEYILPNEPQGSYPVSAYAAGRCEAGEEATYVMVSFQDGAYAVYSRWGGAPIQQNPFEGLPSPGPGYLSGCVADQSGSEHRLLVGSQGPSDWRLFVEFEMSPLLFTWRAMWSGVNFAPAVGSEPGTLLVARLGADSPEVSRLRILTLPGVADIELEEVDSVPMMAMPETFAAGDMDGDDRVDVVGVFPLRSISGTEEYYAQAVLGLTHRGKPVSGMLPLGYSQLPPRAWMADFDGNGVDDLVVLRMEECENGNNDCQEICNQEFERCMQEQDPQMCEQLFGECLVNCEQEDRCRQYLDIYPMGS